MTRKLGDFTTQTGGSYIDKNGQTRISYLQEANRPTLWENDKGEKILSIPAFLNIAALPRREGKDNIMFIFTPVEQKSQQQAQSAQQTQQSNINPVMANPDDGFLMF